MRTAANRGKREQGIVDRLDDIRIPRHEREAAKAYLRGGEEFADFLLKTIEIFRGVARSAERRIADFARRVKCRIARHA